MINQNSCSATRERRMCTYIRRTEYCANALIRLGESLSRGAMSNGHCNCIVLEFRSPLHPRGVDNGRSRINHPGGSRRVRFLFPAPRTVIGISLFFFFFSPVFPSPRRFAVPHLGRYRWGHPVVSSGSARELPIKNGYKIFIVYRYISQGFGFSFGPFPFICVINVLYTGKGLRLQNVIKQQTRFRITIKFNLVFYRRIFLFYFI